MSVLPMGKNTPVKVGAGNLTLSSDYLILLLELGIELGLKQSDLLLGSQLDASILISPGISIGEQSFLKVVANFRQRRSDMSLAVTYGKRMTLSKHGALGVAALHSRTTGDAAVALAAYMSTRAQIFTIRRHIDADNRRLYVELEIDANEDVYFLVLAYLTSIEFILRQMLDYPDDIHTRIELPITPDSWQGKPLSENEVELDQRALGAKIIFSARQCMLLWPTGLLDNLLPQFDQDLVSMAQGVCEDELQSMSQYAPKSQVVAQAFLNAKGELPTIDRIASTLNISSATLKRKLKSEGNSFRDIKDETLHKRSTRLLKETEQSIELIAEQLGYSDASNFAKAFKGWSGMSPSDFRKK